MESAQSDRFIHDRLPHPDLWPEMLLPPEYKLDTACNCSEALLDVADAIVRLQRDDVFIGTSPLAFTFGLCGLLLCPLYAGATSVLKGGYTPRTRC